MVVVLNKKSSTVQWSDSKIVLRHGHLDLRRDVAVGLHTPGMSVVAISAKKGHALIEREKVYAAFYETKSKFLNIDTSYFSYYGDIQKCMEIILGGVVVLGLFLIFYYQGVLHVAWELCKSFKLLYVSYAGILFAWFCIFYPGLFGQDTVESVWLENHFTFQYSSLYMIMAKFIYSLGGGGFVYLQAVLSLAIFSVLLYMLNNQDLKSRFLRIASLLILTLTPISVITIFTTQRFYLSTLVFALSMLTFLLWTRERKEKTIFFRPFIVCSHGAVENRIRGDNSFRVAFLPERIRF